MSKQLESILSRAPRATVGLEVVVPSKNEQPVQPPRQETPSAETPAAAAAARVRDVSLGIEVPESVKRAVAMKAATEGITNRTVLLRALQAAGIDVPEDELRDRRK
jgi:propanediol dehydratase small subunit